MLATKHHTNMLFYGFFLLEIFSIVVAQRVAPGGKEITVLSYSKNL